MRTREYSSLREKVKMKKSSYSEAIIVEGRDDVDAVQKAVSALIIPTHGFGIRTETWALIEKAYKERGLIVLTDPDFSGEEIRKKILTRCPNAINAYIAQDDATTDGDIGVENATPEVIAEAIRKATENAEAIESCNDNWEPVSMEQLVELGLCGVDGSSEKRAKICKHFGIGYGNGKALLGKLTHWKIGIKELEQAIKEIQ